MCLSLTYIFQFVDLYCQSDLLSGFDLTTRDSYFTILVEVFTNHVSAENTYFTNYTEQIKKNKLFGNVIDFKNILMDDFQHRPFPYQIKVL